MYQRAHFVTKFLRILWQRAFRNKISAHFETIFWTYISCANYTLFWWIPYSCTLSALSEGYCCQSSHSCVEISVNPVSEHVKAACCFFLCNLNDSSNMFASPWIEYTWPKVFFNLLKIDELRDIFITLSDQCRNKGVLNLAFSQREQSEKKNTPSPGMKPMFRAFGKLKQRKGQNWIKKEKTMAVEWEEEISKLIICIEMEEQHWTCKSISNSMQQRVCV